MAFNGAHYANAANGTFNDVRRDQYNVQIQISSLPHLAQSCSSAQLISSMVARVDIDREQMQVLSNSVNTLLRALDVEYSAGRLVESATSVALEGLNE